MLTEDLTNKFNAIKTVTSSSVQDAMNKATSKVASKVTSFDNHLINSIGKSITSNLDAWLVNHPFLHWLVNHPLISLFLGLIAVILVVRLFLTIYRAIATTIDRMWLWILQSPFLLFKFVFGWEVKSKTVPANTTITSYEITNDPEQLKEIMTRLDIIQRQQEQILQDLDQLKQQGKTTTIKQIKLSKQRMIGDHSKINNE